MEYFSGQSGLVLGLILFVAAWVAAWIAYGWYRDTFMPRFWEWNERKYGTTFEPETPPVTPVVPLVRRRFQATLHLQDRQVQRVNRFLGADVPRGVVMETNPGMPNRHSLRFPQGFYIPEADRRRLQARAGNAFHFEIFVDYRVMRVFIHTTEQLAMEFLASSQTEQEHLRSIVEEVCSMYAEWAMGKANAQAEAPAEVPAAEPSHRVRMRQRRAACVPRQDSKETDTVNPTKQ
jgi:hypothetical protein